MWETAKMSYCTSGCLFMLLWNMMFLQKEYTIHLAVVSYMPPTPLGVGNIVKTECNPQMIYTSIVWFVFQQRIELFARGAGALWPLHIEWISNFKGCWKRSHGDPMSRLGLWLGTNKATVASTSDRWHEPNNNSSPDELLWQRTAAQPSQHPRRHKHVNVRMIAQHRCQWRVVEVNSEQYVDTALPIDCLHVMPHGQLLAKLNRSWNGEKKTKQIYSRDNNVQNICCC